MTAVVALPGKDTVATGRQLKDATAPDEKQGCLSPQDFENQRDPPTLPAGL